MELYGQGSVPYCSVVEREFEVKRACNQLICNGIDIPPKSPFDLRSYCFAARYSVQAPYTLALSAVGKGGLGAASVIMELYGQGSVPYCSVVERESEVRYES